MKYKAGDRVKIKSLDWYNQNKDEYGYVRCIDFLFTPEHSKYCGCEFTISHITEFQIPSYVMESNGHEWTDEMIEGLAEEMLDKEMEEHQRMCDEIMAIQGIEPIEAEMEQVIHCPDGYIFKDKNGNVINATKIVLEKKKEYPKTFDECLKVLELNDNNILETTVANGTRPYGAELWGLYQLLLCRDAYWKIAGEEMGLGKPWEPDYTEDSYEQGCPIKYVIYYTGTHITKERKCTPYYIFSFPTPEMRDAFKKNFDPDIEFCKEFL